MRTDTGIPIPTCRSSRQSSRVRNHPLSSDALLHAISSPLEAMTLQREEAPAFLTDRATWFRCVAN